MKSNIKIAALFLATCVFAESTVFGYWRVALHEGETMLNQDYRKNFEVDSTESIVNRKLDIINPIFLPDGGPDQPEVQSFTPIGTSDMVDPFTGDFSYNIPLLDVDGYPINISYSAGVTMDQEASWVGLGWNLNPGVVNRAMRGLPDDFDGTDHVEKEMNLRRNWTVGVTPSFDFELFGFGELTEIPGTQQLNPLTGEIIPGSGTMDESNSFNLNASLGINYNNYSGFSSTVSLGPSLSFDQYSNTGWNVGLGFSGSSTGGASLSPSGGLNWENKKGDKVSKINLGSQFNSRAGLTNASISYSRTKGKEKLMKRNGNEYRYNDNKTLPISSKFNFSQPTYIPQIALPFSSGGGTFTYKMGPDVLGADLHFEISGFYNAQWLRHETISMPAYGFMNLQNGDKKSMLDFNRENDGSFTKNTPALPVPNLTYDIFSVSGQGISGSYRPVRKDIGHVYDPSMHNGSTDGSLGLEFGLGSTFKSGVDISLTYSNSSSGDWNDWGNKARNTFKYGSTGWYFREANELAVDGDPDHFTSIGGGNPLRFDVKSHRRIDNTLDDTQGNFYSSDNYVKSGTDKRNQVVYTLTNGEMKEGLGVQELHPSAHAWTTDELNHHLGQFTVLNVEGSRYVYGIAAYSHFQQDVSFNVGSTRNSGPNDVDCVKNLVNYEPDEDNSLDNERGIDYYYNKVTTPDYAHSYLLTSVLNADYVDADNIKGPSKGDLGGYLSFSYKKINNYLWRNPVNQNKASFDEGLNTDNSDDKGHYIFGEKELWYVQTIQSKNHIAVFYTSKRKDAVSVIGENGGLVDNSNEVAMQKLDRIELYSLPEYEANPTGAIPLKTVHFEYNYSLCEGFDGNIENQGKLTLTRIYFTYQGSNKGRYTPYEFQYGERFNSDGTIQTVINPEYNIKETDRWNNYKPQGVCSGNISEDPLRPTDFPYVGMNKTASDRNATAWNLTTINLPSGGKIQVEYESDDYAYVQNLRASQMFRIIGVQKVTEVASNEIISSGVSPLSEDENKNGYIYVELLPDPSSPSGYNENISDYVTPGQQIYFRALMRFTDETINNNTTYVSGYDYVPGYAYVSELESDLDIIYVGNQPALRIKLKGASLKDNGGSTYNPIAVAAIQFARIHLSKLIPPSSSSSMDEDANLPGLIESIGGAFTSFQEYFTGPNKSLWYDNIGNNIVIGKSWVRLQNPNKQKLGGGHRVKKIKMYDSWFSMTQEQMSSQFYGQEYSYKLEDGTSSGVASYEPLIGGDENSWRKPLAANQENLLAPDTRNYQEVPFGEQFFPAPSVGYSMVTIRDIQREGVSRTATGKVVHEFYTAKDYPTIARYTNLDIERFKLPVFTVFFSSMVDEMAASQGFVIENNDMHGKVKRQSVFAQNQNEPITKVEYFYQSEPLIMGSSVFGFNPNIVPAQHLTNNVTTISKNGQIGESTIGLTYEAVADFRKSTSNTVSGSLEINTNVIVPALVVPTIMGSGSYERTAFRSATFTKVIERFGLLTKTVATDLGSVVETNNLAYDAETGTVLLTQTTTDFNDKVYSFTYPAHWYYDQMGQAYRNVGKLAVDLQFVNGGTGQVNSSEYSRGDELAIRISGSNSYVTAWVTEASPSGIIVLLKDGTPLEGNVSTMKVLRSGRRNLQTTPIGTLALRDNPLDNIQGNIFEKVLQAGSVEYSDDWRTFCECFLNEDSDNYTTNPYVLGTKGTWRPVASYVHLSGRSQSFENGNSNIREDGMFTSFNPFYKLIGGNWNIDRQNWTFTSSVVEFSPFGQALETVDALNRYSSSIFGYNQSLPIAVAANTRYRQLGYDGFEDYNYLNCSDNHFKIGENATVVSDEAHTGRHSIKVNSGSSVVFSNTFIEGCDDNPCAISTKTDMITVDKVHFTQTYSLIAIGGTAPYQFEYQIIEGNASVELNENGNGLIIQDGLEGSPNQTAIRILITDSNGCQFIIEL
ncbi:MAG: hypothetical protein EP305_04490 [Bacteroidetes bacterium]|nr:MAG: hypothetical protein EP305_04490 [Bacteroidota bacterium]